MSQKIGANLTTNEIKEDNTDMTKGKIQSKQNETTFSLEMFKKGSGNLTHWRECSSSMFKVQQFIKQVQSYTSIAQQFSGRRKKDQKFKVIFGCLKFEVRLDYVKTYFKTKKEKQRKQDQ